VRSGGVQTKAQGNSYLSPLTSYGEESTNVGKIYKTEKGATVTASHGGDNARLLKSGVKMGDL